MDITYPSCPNHVLLTFLSNQQCLQKMCIKNIILFLLFILPKCWVRISNKLRHPNSTQLLLCKHGFTCIVNCSTNQIWLEQEGVVLIMDSGRAAQFLLVSPIILEKVCNMSIWLNYRKCQTHAAKCVTRSLSI